MKPVESLPGYYFVFPFNGEGVFVADGVHCVPQNFHRARIFLSDFANRFIPTRFLSRSAFTHSKVYYKRFVRGVLSGGTSYVRINRWFTACNSSTRIITAIPSPVLRWFTYETVDEVTCSLVMQKRKLIDLCILYTICVHGFVTRGVYYLHVPGVFFKMLNCSRCGDVLRWFRGIESQHGLMGIEK